MELTKARLTTLVLITTLVGFLYGMGEGLDALLMFHTLFATGLVAAGAAILNQAMEKRPDGLMKRTADRPLPAERISLRHAYFGGIAVTLAGSLYLGLAANWLAAGLALLTSLIYLGIYTPAKQITVHNTVIGAVSGAIPPMIGWAVATGSLGWEAWFLFGILFCWQMPHFLAIAWMYREQYAGAGFRMWPAIDPKGITTAWLGWFFAVAALVISLLPVFLGVNNVAYAIIASLAGAYMIWRAVKFIRLRSQKNARQLFLSSLAYLPMVLGALVFTIN